MAETDLADWFPIDRAAAALGCSTRTVERLGKARQLEQRLRRQEGTPPVAVYNPDDVARIASERRRDPAPFVLPAVQPGNGNGTGLTYPNRASGRDLDKSTAGDTALIRQFLTLAVQAFQSPPSPPVAASVAETLTPAERGAQYVTLQEAAAIKRVSDRLLLRWIRNGSLVAAREPRSVWTKADRGWRIQRKDLEAL